MALTVFLRLCFPAAEELISEGNVIFMPHCMQYFTCCTFVISVSFCVWATPVSPAKTAELIDTLFVERHMGSGSRVLSGSAHGATR